MLVLDAGDTIQGTPIEYLHARRPNDDPDPMSMAMSAVGYDAMAVGNHEFNYGLDVLHKAQKEESLPLAFREHAENGRRIGGISGVPRQDGRRRPDRESSE